MSTAFLCVQFRNLLPSEQLVLFGRALWNDMLLQQGPRMGAGDAVLAITQHASGGHASDAPTFEAELRLPRTARRGGARDRDALVAIDKAFGLWTDHAEAAVVVGVLDDASQVGQNATCPLGG